MSVAKVTEISAESPDGFEAAIQVALKRASKTLKHVESAWVKEQHVRVSEGRIQAYRVHLKVTFILDD